MSQETELQELGLESIYNPPRVGSFGRFKTGESFPIEYLMTTFSPTELYDQLVFARDIETAHLDFDLLMQRDIDEDRVREEMEPYLCRTTRSAPERRDTVFFPPLLVAIVPVQNEKMLEFYSEEHSDLDVGEKKLVVREWEPFFQLRYLPSKAPDATIVEIDGKHCKINRNQAELLVRIAKGDDRGCRLVVIDGQHRLLALRRVYENNRAALKDLVVPVCIVFPPKATTAYANQMEPVRIPTVPQVFRSLFVDVNETMEKVGGHFTILLSDNTIPNIAARKFCDATLKTKGKPGLAAIEWNIRSRKDSYELNRPYSVTSVGIIARALEQIFKGERPRLSFALNLAEVGDSLHPDGQDEEEYPRNVQWDTFSISQRPTISSQVEKYLVPALDRIFFGIEQYSLKFKSLTKQLDLIDSVASDLTPGSDDARIARKLQRHLLDYRPLTKSDDDVLKLKGKILKSIETESESRAAIVDYALFQRALFDVWAIFLDECRALEDVSLSNATNALVLLVNLALKGNGQNFVFTEPYMQHSVFAGSRIKTREETRRTLTRLMLAHLGSPKIATSVAKELSVGSSSSIADLQEHLLELGLNSASLFAKSYSEERAKAFKRGYLVDLSIEKDRRDELAVAEKQFRQEWAEYQAGQRPREEVSATFENIVREEVNKDVELAMHTLKMRIGLQVEVLLSESEGLEADDSL